jgi:hypothetical protein
MSKELQEHAFARLPDYVAFLFFVIILANVF